MMDTDDHKAAPPVDVVSAVTTTTATTSTASASGISGVVGGAAAASPGEGAAEDAAGVVVGKVLGVNAFSFIDDVFDVVDDYMNDGLEDISAKLKELPCLADRHALVEEGLKRVGEALEATMDDRLSNFEDYALKHMFSVPSSAAQPPHPQPSIQKLVEQSASLDSAILQKQQRLRQLADHNALLSSQVKQLQTTNGALQQQMQLVSSAMGDLKPRTTADLMNNLSSLVATNSKVLDDLRHSQSV
ncbi:hypothetical protein Pelo_6754 [Pelomyxa schiedti]|nr:hypothetical protein Pelo_6754 [Pelomyxa schiedti]